LIGFGQMLNGLKIFLKMHLENQIRKRKFPFLPPPSFRPERPSQPAAVPAEPARAHAFFPFLFLGRPSLAQQPRRPLPSLSG
jgi:hypothetical protein